MKTAYILSFIYDSNSLVITPFFDKSTDSSITHWLFYSIMRSKFEKIVSLVLP